MAASSLLIVGDFSGGANDLEAYPFRWSQPTIYLNLGPHCLPALSCTDWPSVRGMIARGEIGCAIVTKPFDRWNPRKAWWRNLIHRFRRAPSLLRTPLPAILRALRQAAIPIAGLDMTDAPVIDNCRFPVLSVCDAFFKRELPCNTLGAFLYTTDRAQDLGNIARQAFFRTNAAKLQTVSLGIPDETFAAYQSLRRGEAMDLFFAGDFTDRPARVQGRDALLDLAARNGLRMEISDGKYQPPEYRQKVIDSMICWSPDGFGCDCNRTYEAGAAASVPLLRRPWIRAHAPFEDGVDAIHYAREDRDLATRVEAYLRDRNKLAEMGRRAQARVQEFHLHSQLLKYIVSTTQLASQARREGVAIAR